MNKLFCLVLCALITTTLPARAEGDEYYRAVAKMLELNGSLAVVDVTMDQLAEVMKPSAGSVPDAIWERALKKLGDKVRARLVDIYVPIYEQYLSLDDINGLNAIYETPLMQKMTAILPAVMYESGEAGMQLGYEVLAEMQEELAAEGYEL